MSFNRKTTTANPIENNCATTINFNSTEMLITNSSIEPALARDDDKLSLWNSKNIKSQFTIDPECKNIDYREYQRIVHCISVYALYENKWGIRGCVLPRICGKGGKFSSCECINLSNAKEKCSKLQHDFNSSACDTFKSIFPFLVPHNMPYMMHYSDVSGPICSTPFFSIICAKIKQIPNQLFMLSSLNLESVMSNPIFRHELIFNPDLYIKDPTLMHISRIDEQLSVPTICEIEDLKYSPMEHSPLIFLPQLIEGLRMLMGSILPESLVSEVNYHLDPSRILCGDRVLISEFLEGFVCFISTVLDACVIPLRCKLVNEMKLLIYRGIEHPERLFKGIMLSVDLLNLTKVDQINSRIRERVSVLYATSTAFEKFNFAKFVEYGGVNWNKVRVWLTSQPFLEVENAITRSDLAMTVDSVIIGQLVLGFLRDFIATDSCQLNLFYLDNARIRVLRKRFRKLVLKRFAVNVTVLYSKQDKEDRATLKNIVSVPDMHKSKLYLCIEQRVLSELLDEVYKRLIKLISGYPSEKSASLTEGHNKRDEFLINEIVVVLHLHWNCAGSLYTNDHLIN